MPGLPNAATAYAAADSQWVQTYTLTDNTGAPINLTGLAFEFVVRPSISNVAEPALITLSTSGPTSQGSIAVTPLTGVVTVTLTPAATALLGQGTYAYALWSAPGTSTATCWVQGSLISQPVPIP